MRQLLDTQRVVYVEQDEAQPVMVVRTQRKRKRPPVFLYTMSPFLFGCLALVCVVFLVEDVQWLMERMLLLLLLLFLGGTAAGPLVGIVLAIREWREAFYE